MTQLTPKDCTSFVAAAQHGSALRVWDDGYGPLWVYRGPYGIRVIVRAQTWETAYEAAIDTLPTIPPQEIPEAYGFNGWDSAGKRTETVYSPETAKTRFDAYLAAAERGEHDLPELIEGYQYQSNASGTGIVSTDYDDRLDPLTIELLRDLDLQIKLKG